MNINFNLKEYKKEIIVILIYVVIFSSLLFINHLLNVKNEDIKNEEMLSKVQYNRISSIKSSKETLEKELNIVELKVREINQKLPSDLEYRKINEMLAEISLNTGNVFNLGNCNISEIKGQEGYSTYQVKINTIQGSYSQIQDMLEYIKNYSSKIAITQFSISKNLMQADGSMTLMFYGKA